MHVKRNSRKSEKKFNITLNKRKNSISARNAQEMAFLSAALHFAPLKQRLKRKCFYQTWLLADIYSHQFIRAAVKKKQPTSPANVRHIAICGNFVVILMRMVTPMRMPYFVASATRMHFKCLPDK